MTWDVPPTAPTQGTGPAQPPFDLGAEAPASQAANAEKSGRPDLKAALTVVGALWLLAVPAGWAWQHWSPHTLGYVRSPDSVIIPAEDESEIAADSRLLMWALGFSLVATALLWAWRSRRGPFGALSVVLAGGGAGTIIALVGRATSGGKTSGKINTVIELPIELHAVGLLAVGPLIGLVIYLVLTLFAPRDDLGRPDRPKTVDPWNPSGGPWAGQGGYEVGNQSLQQFEGGRHGVQSFDQP